MMLILRYQNNYSFKLLYTMRQKIIIVLIVAAALLSLMFINFKLEGIVMTMFIIFLLLIVVIAIGSTIINWNAGKNKEEIKH